MKYRTLGKSGLRVSLVGLGCNNFGGRTDRELSCQVIHRALDLGINFFDTADVYPVHGENGSAEKILGYGLGQRRKEIVLATKFGMAMDQGGFLKGASRRYILTAVEASLRRLDTDWIDLYQVHTPDPLTPIEETLRALEDLVRQGKIRYFGCSNFSSWQLADARWTALSLGITPIISCQSEYSLLRRDSERELIPAIEKYGIGLLPYFPLAGGFLSGKYKPNQMPEGGRLTNSQFFSERFITTDNWTILKNLGAFCAKHSCGLLEIAIAWLAAKRVVSSVIAGATRPEQVEQNVAAIDFSLTSNDVGEIDRLTTRA